MVKWLTTGQMIDELKIGEVAEIKVKYQIPEQYGHSYKHVTKNGSEDIKWCLEDKSEISNTPLILYGHTVNWKWRILPKYVSFTDAIKAFKDEGKTIVNHVKLNTYYYYWKDGEPKCKTGDGLPIGTLDLPFTETFEGKWTIEEENK